MADKIDEETLENSMESQTENKSEEIINESLEIKNMEVHHHPDLHHKPKKWKEYFLEFIMIFLAVTMGFIAENIRESIKEKREINENIESVLSDLESDVTHLNSILETNTYSYTAADSLIALLHNDINNTPQIYLYGRAVTANFSSTYSNSKTFDLMKSSGLLKLIRPRKLLDSLGLYYARYENLSKQDDLIRLKQDAVHRSNYLLFDTYVFSQMKVGYDTFNRSHTIVQPPSGHPALLSTDYKTVNEVALNYYYMRASLKFGCIGVEKQKQLGIRIIELIKKEYHLK